jgi:ribonucleoside-diphosphate reductase alpha chain
MHNLEYVHPFSSVNPCGEQPLPVNGCCLLASLILPSFVKDGKIDYDLLARVIRIAVRFMDDVIDNCEYPLPDMRRMEESERRIGLGTMGIHDLLIALEKGYDTEEGRSTTEEILEFLRDETYKASIDIAKEKGPFPCFDKAKYVESGFIKTLPEHIIKDIYKHGVRNACAISQAPTGTIGSMYNVSSGCEPWFSLSFQRNTRLGSYEDGCPSYLEWKKSNPGKAKPSYFKTAQDISPEDHVKMLMLFSRYVDSSCSKTVNLPSTTTVNDVKKTYLMAMENGVKGVTVFRDGCKKAVLVNKEVKDGEVLVDPEDKDPSDLDEIPVTCTDTRMKPIVRGNRTVGGTSRVHMDKHNMYITVNKNYQGELVEIFVRIGASKDANSDIGVQTSGVEDSWASAVAKITSLALRAGVKPEAIIKNLKNIPSDKPTFVTICDNDSVELIPSPPHAIGRVIEEELKKYVTQNIPIKDEDLNSIKGYCTSCGSTEITWRNSACGKCNSCGNEDCGSIRRTN